MIVVSAPTIEDAPLEHARQRFSFGFVERVEARIETFLEAERGQLPLWFVALFAGGIAMWMWLPGPRQWAAFIALALGLAVAGVAWGRERLGGALLVLLFRPEALAGASFQMSFGAVTSIIVLHQSRCARELLGHREEGWPFRLWRFVLGLLLTGLVVEFALIPLAL